MDIQEVDFVLIPIGIMTLIDAFQHHTDHIVLSPYENKRGENDGFDANIFLVNKTKKLRVPHHMFIGLGYGYPPFIK